MRKYSDLFQKYDLKPNKIKIIGKATIIDTDKGKYVLKPKNRKYNNNTIFKYLNSRSFDYYPKIYSDDSDDYDLVEYVEEVEEPKEQKISDLIEIVSLLHNKTTHYKDVDEDDYKKIYEDVKNNIEYLTEYYNDMMEIIESKVFMSPSEYFLAQNISKIYGSLNYCNREIEKWYEIISKKRKQRFVVLHNNLELSHFIKNKNAYLLNWEKSRIDIPIFDLYKLYKRHALDFDFVSLLKQYEKNYPLLEEERLLFFILISLPERLEFDDNDLKLCIKFSKVLEYMYKTENLLSPYYAENRK